LLPWLWNPLGPSFIYFLLPGTRGGGIPSEPLLSLRLIAYYFLLFSASYYRYSATDAIKKKLFVMYLSWLFAVPPIIFLFANALGGFNVANGGQVGTTYAQRLPQYLYMTCLGTLWAHLYFVPWIFLTRWLLNLILRSKKLI
jgi:hypothetical protein